MKNLPSLLISLLLSLSLSSQAAPISHEPPYKVLATVHPLALMAASLVEAEQLSVLLPPGMTPHDFSLRPSDIDVIQSADVIIWSGAQAEPYLSGFARRWPDKIWIDVSQLRAEGQPNDGHWWFSPTMMVRAQQQLANALELPAGNFAADVDAALQRADQLLTPLRDRGFFVFHRAYDHWVQAMQLKQVGAFTLSPEQKPGLKTLQRMRDQLTSGEVVCVFSEPEFSPALVQSVVRGLDVKQGELDPVASHISVTKTGYPDFIQDLAQRFATCLSPD